MPNHMLLSQQIENEIAKGLPEGTTENLLKNLPYVLNRIKELETALAPFATAYVRNKTVADQYKLELTQVYTKDLRLAFDVLDINQSYVPKKQVLFPA